MKIEITVTEKSGHPDQVFLHGVVMIDGMEFSSVSKMIRVDEMFEAVRREQRFLLVLKLNQEISEYVKAMK